MKQTRSDSVPADHGSDLQFAEAWFGSRGWHVFDFQRTVWQAYLDGQSGLIHAPTGTGKTLAAWWGPLLAWHAAGGSEPPRGLRVLWITPLRALAADSEQSLLAPIRELGLPWTVERRTGDVSSYAKQRQLKRPPNALITTPESLSLLLSQPNAKEYFRQLEAVIVDEWHELLASKRGVQTELCLARLRAWRGTTGQALRTWGLSATLGNLDTAMSVLMGVQPDGSPRPGRLVQGLLPKAIVIDSLIPEQMERFPWAGHLGLKMLPQAIAAIEEGKTALVFTNTRSQTESWFQALLDARPDWAGEIALHHGSLSAGDARLCRERPARRQPALRRLHLQPGSGRGLFARGPRAAGRQPEGCGAPPAARRPQRAPTGRHLARDVCTDPCV